MLDTKLKKMRRLKNSIIILCALIPALILVALYPTMEDAALKRQEEVKNKSEQQMEEYFIKDYYVEDNFINYAVEASYYIYGQMLQKQLGTPLDFSVLHEYGWVNDYYYVNENALYYAKLGSMQKANTSLDLEALLLHPMDETPEELKKEGVRGFVTLHYDTYGELSNVFCYFDEDIAYYSGDIYRRAQESIEKYLNNTQFYLSQIEETPIDSNVQEDALQNENAQITEDINENRLQKYQNVCPKDFSVVFAITDGAFIWEQSQAYYGYYGYDMESAYVDIGSIGVVIVLAVFVALAALILPFFKKLNTGKEKLFCIPLEIVFVFIACGIAGAVGMFVLMCHTNLTELQMMVAERPINFIGNNVSAENLYRMLLCVNFLGWSVLFFFEYVVVSSFRQFLCGPITYLKHRLIIVKIFKWMKRGLKKYSQKLYKYVTDIDINDKMISSISKIVGINFVILVVLCSMWFFGIAGLLVYSVILFVVMRKYGEKLRQQFRSILNAANQMANGNLRIKMEEELGIFDPIGKGLEGIQRGFSKAVAEEAKSQNMKTELITNVSHDLKTPLTSIITYVELLKKEGITEEERNSYIATIDQKSQRLKVLIEDLFEVSKANSGNIQMHFMDVDVVDLMKQVRLEMEEKIVNSDLNFRWNLPQKHIVLFLDGQRTYRIFENLLNNILKYSMPHTRVYIDIQEVDDDVHITFRNISAMELNGDSQNLTERFVRGDVSRNTEGSGLGLAIVKSFVELQNGKLKIDVDGDLFKVSILWNKKTEKTINKEITNEISNEKTINKETINVDEPFE